MHKAWCSLEDVPQKFLRSSIKFQGHIGWKIDDLYQIWARLLGRSQLWNPSDLPCFVNIFESSGVLYISPTHTSSMQELIMQGLQQKLEKSCFRCNKNTWHVESNHILQPPNYLIIVVNRFRYINNQFAKDKCSIPMDMTVVLGYHKFSLQATIDHHGPSIYSGHYTTSVNCCNRTFYCNDNKITEFDMINTKNSSTAYVVIYKLIT